MTIKYSVGLPAIVTKIVLTGLMMAVSGVICPAAAPSVPSAQNVDLEQLSGCQMTEADFNSLPDDEQKKMLNDLLRINGNRNHQAFLDAAKKGFLWAIAPLIKRGVLRASPEVGTALGIAAANGDTEMVKLLLERGSKGIVNSKQGRPALRIAIENNHIAIVRALLIAGADIDKYNNTNALIWPAEHGRIKMVEELLIAKANPNIAGQCGTALAKAAGNGHIEIVKLLLASGPNSNIADQCGAALANAADKRHTEIVKLLLASGAPQNWLSLVMAAGKGHTEIVKLLIAAQTDQIIDNKLGGSTLIEAIRHGHTEIVELLLTAGVSPHGVDENGMTDLMLASSQGNHTIVQLLLAAKADSTILSQNGKTALSCAAEYGHIDIVKELLATVAHSNINICDNALRSTAANGHSAIVKLLLAAQANVNSVDQNYGWTALSLAVEGHHIDVIKQLLAAGANPDVGIRHNDRTALMFTVIHDHPNATGIIELLLAARAHVDIVDHNGRTALMHAASFGHIFAIKELITTGANLDIVDQYGKTACAYAFSHDSHRFEMGSLFIDAYRQQLVNKTCACIQHINDSQAPIELATLALNSDIKTAFEQLPAECSDLIMQRLPISSLGCIRQVSKACHAMVEFPLLIKALKQKNQREQEEKLLKIVEKQIRQAQGDGEIEEQEQGDGGIEEQDYCKVASSIIEQFGGSYDFWQAAITQQLAMQDAKQAQPLRGMFTQVRKK